MAQTVSFAPAVSIGVGQSPWALSTGDFNEDGKLDLAVANQNDDTVSILLGACPTLLKMTDLGG
jgi:hypothetical protein